MENQKLKKILIIEDDEKFALSLTAFLAGHGYQATVAFDATQAIRYATNENIGLIILDLGLPGGGGLFVIENLRKMLKTSGVPIIVLTVNIALGVEEKAREMGANDFIRKPYDPEKLLEKIRTFLP